jgi:NTP pyrophosphatase (non-canonical NTP hydrolase)
MDFNEYQMLSKETAQGPADPDVGSKAEKQYAVQFLALAVNGEAGELGEKVKKYAREDDDAYLEDAKAEIGDVLWYLSQLASLLDEDLSSIAEDNLEKLQDREERDKITGEGDHR